MSTVLDDESAKKNLAANVAKFRGNRSRGWLARAVGVGTISISRIENGDHLPRAGLLSRLAEALGVSIDALLTDPSKSRVRRA